MEIVQKKLSHKHTFTFEEAQYAYCEKVDVPQECLALIWPWLS